MAKESAPGALLEGRNPEDPQDGAHGGCRVRSSGRRRSRDGTDRYLPTNPFRRPDRDRGQTTQDFAVGVSIFLLVLAGTVAFLPNVFAPYDQNVGSVERQQAVRIADTLVSDDAYAITDQSATVDYGAIESEIAGDVLLSGLRDKAGIADTARISVAFHVRPGISSPAIIHESGSFAHDGSTLSSWEVLESTDRKQLDSFEMTIQRSTLTTPFQVVFDDGSGPETVEITQISTHEVEISHPTGTCTMEFASGNDVATVSLDYEDGAARATSVVEEVTSCSFDAVIDPGTAYSVEFVDVGSGGYPEGSYHIGIGEPVSTSFLERSDFADDAGSPETAIVKVGSGGSSEAALHAATQRWDEQPAVTVRRFVRFDSGSPAADECKPVCELVVRVW